MNTGYIAAQVPPLSYILGLAAGDGEAEVLVSHYSCRASGLKFSSWFSFKLFQIFHITNYALLITYYALSTTRDLIGNLEPASVSAALASATPKPSISKSMRPASTGTT